MKAIKGKIMQLWKYPSIWFIPAVVVLQVREILFP
jgi:hypothetical protein